MKQYLCGERQAETLILCFLGWDTTPAVAEHLQAEGRAVLFCWDYRESQQPSIPPQIKNIFLVAWSLGVWAAEESAAHLSLRQAVAINGTPRPIDAQSGIPPAIFTGTRQQLTPQTRQKFARRICDSQEEWQRYQQFPAREFHAVKEELFLLEKRILSTPSPERINWQHAFIGSRDRIFPPANQQHYWQEKSHFFVGGHNLFPHLTRWSQLFSLLEGTEND